MSGAWGGGYVLNNFLAGSSDFLEPPLLACQEKAQHTVKPQHVILILFFKELALRFIAQSAAIPFAVQLSTLQPRRNNALLTTRQ